MEIPYDLNYKPNKTW